jgi:hypothetical protein
MRLHQGEVKAHVYSVTDRQMQNGLMLCTHEGPVDTVL